MGAVYARPSELVVDFEVGGVALAACLVSPRRRHPIHGHGLRQNACSYGPPDPAGLSHVTEEFEEEGIVPPGALELTAQGDCPVRVSLGDVEGQASEDSQIGWSVVLAIAREVFVENAIERPVKAIFDTPMSADDAQDFFAAVGTTH